MRVLTKSVAVPCLAALILVLVSGPPSGARDDSGAGTGTIGAEVGAPGAGGSGSGASGSGGGGSEGGGGGGGSQGPVDPCPPLPTGADSACKAPEPGEPALPSAEVLAAHARELVVVVVPSPHTSPEGAPQLAGKRTWFWIHPDDWRPVTARAELPGLWAEVTATPTRAVWTPGDGSPAVTCDGPGRPHPGTAGATTTCGHPYTVEGTYTLRLAVTYTVTWTSSDGQSGTQDPFVLTTTQPITVDERQVVVS